MLRNVLPLAVVVLGTAWLIAADPARAACTGTTPGQVAACISQNRLEQIVDDVTGVKLSGSPFWQDTQDYLVAELTSYGYSVVRAPYATGGVNIVATLTGTGSPNESVYITAHYDTIPGCPGANDDGSGLAAGLELASALAGTPNARTLVIVFFDEEEIGLVGSQFYTASLSNPAGIQIVYNFDSFGFTDSTPFSQSLPFGFEALFPDGYADLVANDFRGDFSILIANQAAGVRTLTTESEIESFGTSATSLIVPDLIAGSPLLSDLRRSDHAPFWDLGVPAIQFSDSSEFRNPNYHCLNGFDDASTVDFPFITAVTKGVARDAFRTLNPSLFRCGLGPELALLLPVLGWALRRPCARAAH